MIKEIVLLFGVLVFIISIILMYTPGFSFMYFMMLLGLCMILWSIIKINKK